MQALQLKVDVNEVHEMIRGYPEASPDVIQCLLKAEGTVWKLDGCRFLLSQVTTSQLDEREKAYLIESAAGMLASVFDVLLHEVVYYFGLDNSIEPKDVRWSKRFRRQLERADSRLLTILEDARDSPWCRRARGLRHYVTHHAGLLQHVTVQLPSGDQTFSMVGDKYFQKNDDVDPPESFVNGYLDRQALISEVTAYVGEMCRLVDRVRLHCFDTAPVFRAGRERKGSEKSHDV